MSGSESLKEQATEIIEASERHHRGLEAKGVMPGRYHPGGLTPHVGYRGDSQSPWSVWCMRVSDRNVPSHWIAHPPSTAKE
jgi:hypothetical protein